MDPLGFVEVLAAMDNCGCDMGHPSGSPPSWFSTLAHSAMTPWAIGGLTLAGTTLVFMAWGKGWWPRLLGWFSLRARPSPDAMARHPARGQLLEAIRAAPGVTTTSLTKSSGLNPGTLLHHLRTLERGGRVASLRLGRDRAWYLAADVPRNLRIASALNAPIRRDMLGVIRERSGVTGGDLARTFDLSRATVHHHLVALREAGLIMTERRGLRVLCRIRQASDPPPEVSPAPFFSGPPARPVEPVDG